MSTLPSQVLAVRLRGVAKGLRNEAPPRTEWASICDQAAARLEYLIEQERTLLGSPGVK